MKRNHSEVEGDGDPEIEGREAKRIRIDDGGERKAEPEIPSPHLPSTQAAMWNSSVVKYKSKNSIYNLNDEDDEDDGLLNLYGRILDKNTVEKKVLFFLALKLTLKAFPS